MHLPDAGADVAGIDGPTLPGHRVALARSGSLRPALRLQATARPGHLGSSHRGTPAGRKERRGRTMNQQLVDTIVNAVLYEGYILYPYRASAKKNRQRFTFGRVYPEAYSLAQGGAEPCVMQTECLV